MGTLTIRKLDDEIIGRLKERARRRGRSLESDLRDLLAQSSRQPLILDPVAEADRIAAMTPGHIAQSASSPPPGREDRVRGMRTSLPPYLASPPGGGRESDLRLGRKR